jgi:hypothetical protein
MPLARSTSAAGWRWPSTMNSPSPISASVMCASGARSPEAPTEPWLGTGHQAGVVHRQQRVDHHRPHARVPARQAGRLQASIRPHHRGASGSPTPTLWLRIRLRCSVARSSLLMRVLASLPKPVLTP